MKFDTIKDATYAMVSGLNAFPQGMIKKLMEMEPSSWMEITPPVVGDQVCVYSRHDGDGEIKEIKSDGVYVIELGGRERVVCDEFEFGILKDDILPMWGTMWQFDDPTDTWWLEEKGGMRLMAECGFRIYESEDYGYFFGIDGCGYDFYEAHWIPLYKARGFRWAQEQEKAEAAGEE